MKSTQYVWKKVAVATAAAVLAIGFFGYNAEEGPVEELAESKHAASANAAGFSGCRFGGRRLHAGDRYQLRRYHLSG